MYLFKTRRENIGGVIDNAMHASKRKPQGLHPGEKILVHQTKDNEMLKKGEKPIKYIMTFKSYKEDKNNESGKIWGEHYKYLILCKEVRRVSPFDIQEIQMSQKNYGRVVMDFCKLTLEDEKRVLELIDNS